MGELALLLAAATFLITASAAIPSSAATLFLDVNMTGMPFERALQANVAQGLCNRGKDCGSEACVWLSGVGEGLPAGSSEANGSAFPGNRFIEWKTGHGGGPWYSSFGECRACKGLRGRNWARRLSGLNCYKGPGCLRGSRAPLPAPARAAGGACAGSAAPIRLISGTPDARASRTSPLSSKHSAAAPGASPRPRGYE